MQTVFRVCGNLYVTKQQAIDSIKLSFSNMDVKITYMTPIHNETDVNLDFADGKHKQIQIEELPVHNGVNHL